MTPTYLTSTCDPLCSTTCPDAVNINRATGRAFSEAVGGDHRDGGSAGDGRDGAGAGGDARGQGVLAAGGDRAQRAMPRVDARAG